MNRRTVARIATTLLALGAAIVVFGKTGLDVWLQDNFFDFTTGRWRVNRDATLPRLLFYDGPKVLIIILAAAVLAYLLCPSAWRPRWLHLPWERPQLWLLLLSLAVVPITITTWRGSSSHHCPWALTRYGGSHPYHRLLDPPPVEPKPNCGRCFPAGHASGGFALMSLAFVLRRRWLGLGVGLFFGWMMGIYQMLKGAHFLSHTVVSMIGAWLIIELVALAVSALARRRTGVSPAPAAPAA
jgi:membrane-associated PAP2 superfamily phosphatase